MNTRIETTEVNEARVGSSHQPFPWRPGLSRLARPPARDRRAALPEVVEDWYAGAERGGSVAQLLLRELALGAHHGVIFPRELMLVARSLVGIDATTTLIAPEVSFSEVLKPATARLPRALLPSLEELREGAEKRRFDYLESALELPDLIPDLVARLRSPSPAPGVDRSTAVGRGRGTALSAALVASAAAGFGIARATRRGRH